MKRDTVKTDTVVKVYREAHATLLDKIREKGADAFVSNHEVLGVVTEEHQELLEAVHSNNTEEVRKELMDIVVAALWGICSIDTQVVEEK